MLHNFVEKAYREFGIKRTDSVRTFGAQSQIFAKAMNELLTGDYAHSVMHITGPLCVTYFGDGSTFSTYLPNLLLFQGPEDVTQISLPYYSHVHMLGSFSGEDVEFMLSPLAIGETNSVVAGPYDPPMTLLMGESGFSAELYTRGALHEERKLIDFDVSSSARIYIEDITRSRIRNSYKGK
jgi:hypothetical protein